MTDKQKLTDLLTEFGIPFKNKKNGRDEDCIKVKKRHVPDHPKVEGYQDFYISFVFDSDEKFVKVGIWE